MKKHLIPSLLVGCLVASLCVQNVLAEAAEETPPATTPGTEETIEASFGNEYDQPVEVATGKIIQLPDGSDLVKDGYTFAGWSTDPNATEGFFTYEMPNEDVTLYAVWIPVGEDEEDRIPITPADPDEELPTGDEEKDPGEDESEAEVPGEEPETPETPDPTDPVTPDDSGESTENGGSESVTPPDPSDEDTTDPDTSVPTDPEPSGEGPEDSSKDDTGEDEETTPSTDESAPDDAEAPTDDASADNGPEAAAPVE